MMLHDFSVCCGLKALLSSFYNIPMWFQSGKHFSLLFIGVNKSIKVNWEMRYAHVLMGRGSMYATKGGVKVIKDIL